MRVVLDTDVVVAALRSPTGASAELLRQARHGRISPADELVLETAVNAAADALLSFNLRHFRPAAERFGLLVAPPGPFLHEFLRGTPS